MQIASNKIKDIIRHYKSELEGIYDLSEIETFIAFCFEKYLKIKRAQLQLKLEQTVSESELLKFNFAIKELKKEKPIQYILSEADFYGMKFYVNENVLIPRPETEELVKLIVDDYLEFYGSKNVDILDIGIGSGCIAIALKKNILNSTVTGIDISEKALDIAKRNSQTNKTDVSFVLMDILSNKKNQISEKKFDIIVSNPPYIALSESFKMRKNVLEYEPHLALFVEDTNPLIFYDAIAQFAQINLKNNGKIYFEINEVYGHECKLLLEEKGFKNVMLVKDISNKNRILRGNI